ncbi:MAG: adenosylcobinamide-GDP ribazoletransferase [Chloroflexi bacterium]|nr:adenosylcobinamide-GDP ribazoletransferase [Chloroflexota bacterium]MCL5109102.1 adenosylcobinamide-GDP ribazoletransferase [Chloroflexota bacterium]
MGLHFALRFLTALPLPHDEVRPGEIGRSAAFFPLVGLLVGLTLAALDSLLRLVWPTAVANAGLLIASILLTGGLHLDGLMDSCDGLFGRRDPVRRLEIMRDSRVGSFGVLGAVSVLLLLYACLGELSGPPRTYALVLMATLSRWAMVLSIWGFPYAREDGLGRSFKDGVTWGHLLLATCLALATAALAVLVGLGPWTALVACLSAGLVAVLAGAFVCTRIPGLTGDSYGAIDQLAEVAVLLSFVALARVGYG